MNRIIVILAIVAVLIYPSYSLSQIAVISFTTSDAEAMRDAMILLDQQNTQQAKQDSDTRRGAAISLINSEIKPQLKTVFGTYTTQHTLILDNIRFLENQISTAKDGETKSELRKLLDLELADFKQLKQDHAQGRIS